MKNPGTAAVLSFVVTGLGQIYNGQIAKGLFLVFLQLINIALMFVLIGYLTFALLWIYGIVDAYRSAERINARAP
jgi:TM2 domain-containing membrane protein YozV